MKQYALLVRTAETESDDALLVKKLLISSVDFLNRLSRKDLIGGRPDRNGFNLHFRKPSAPFLYYRLLEVLLYPLEVRGGMSSGNRLEEILEKAAEALDHPLAGLLMNSGGKTDQYLNQFFRLRNEIRDYPTIQANLVQLFSELLFPLLADCRALQNSDMIARLSLILKFKREYFEHLKSNKPSNRFYSHLFPEIDYAKYGELIGTSEPDQKEEGDGFPMIRENYWKKGFSTKVSLILGITRQIIDRNYKYLNYANLRNLDATIVHYLLDNY